MADAIQARYRALVLLAAFSSLRFGELAALTRRDLDLEHRIVRVRRAQVELATGKLPVKDPKSAAGVRPVALPTAVLKNMEEHLRWFGESGSTGRLFVGPKGGKLRRSNFHHIWAKALADAGVLPVHFHDLRHTGNTMAADTGASTRELMHRMGHSTMDAALRYRRMRGGVTG